MPRRSTSPSWRKIRFGLNAVKNVGEAAAQAIVAARETDGAFGSLWDFTERVDPQLRGRALESLVKAGALDSTGNSRKGMLDVLEHALSYGQTKQADRVSGQSSIFDDLPGAEDTPRATPHPRSPPASSRSRAAAAGEGVARPLRLRASARRDSRPAPPQDRIRASPTFERRRDGEVVTVGGIVSAVKQLTTKKGEPMVFLSLGDLTGEAEVVFNSVYAAARAVPPTWCSSSRPGRP